MGPLVVNFVVISLSASVSRLVVHSVPELSLFNATKEVFYFSQLKNATFTRNPSDSLSIANVSFTFNNNMKYGLCFETSIWLFLVI